MNILMNNPNTARMSYLYMTQVGITGFLEMPIKNDY